MDFIGTGKRLAQGDIGEAARWLGVPTAALLAFIEVEAAGRGFDAQNRPKMLFEPHVFWRELGASTARDLAAKLGVAYKSWGAKPYPKESYTRLKTAQTVDAAKALRSASWGLGQILGDKHQICGHSTEENFVRANMQGEREQLLCMTALMIAWGIPKMLAGKDLTKAKSWEPAVEKWNGKSFRVHNYHGRIAAAFVKHDQGLSYVTPAGVNDTLLQIGMKGEAVRNLQNDLAAIGYAFTSGIDGRFGPETDANVRAFQQAYGLTVDGKVGHATSKAIADTVAGLGDKGVAASEPPVFPGQAAPAKAPVWLILGAVVAAAAGIAFAIFSGAFNVG